MLISVFVSWRQKIRPSLKILQKELLSVLASPLLSLPCWIFQFRILSDPFRLIAPLGASKAMSSPACRPGCIGRLLSIVPGSSGELIFPTICWTNVLVVFGRLLLRCVCSITRAQSSFKAITQFQPQDVFASAN